MLKGLFEICAEFFARLASKFMALHYPTLFWTILFIVLIISILIYLYRTDRIQ